MKFLLLVVFGLVAGVFCAPSSDETTEINMLEVSDVNENMQKITEMIEFLSNNTKDSKGSEKMLMTMALNSLDTSCMLTQYEKFKLLNMIPLTDGENLDDTKLVFFGIAAICSSKSFALLDFAFENLMTHRILLEALINDSEMMEYKNMIWCANNYAVKNGIVDPQVYNLKYQLTEETEEMCQDWVAQLKFQILPMKMMTRKQFGRGCITSVISRIEKLALKTVLLLQVDLTDVQKKTEKKSFIKGARKIMEDLLKCAGQEKTEMSDYEGIRMMN